MQKKAYRTKERGNALIYVLIAIALFAALSFTLSRQTDTSEAGALDSSKVELYATQLMSYAAQAQAAVDQLLMSNTLLNPANTMIQELDLTLPTQAGFNTAPHLRKLYHPQGGGLTPGRIPDSIKTTGVSDPVSGWYLGRFNNVDWTATANQEVILIAYQIPEAVCARINQTITGSPAIPVLTNTIRNVFIDDTLHTGTNVDLTTTGGTPICSACNEMASLCVSNAAGTAYGFYSILADE